MSPAQLAGATASRGHPVLTALGPLHDRLLWYVIAAAAAGVSLPDVAARLQGAVPVMLAGQVAGVTLTLTASRLLRVLRHPGPVLAALAAQWLIVAPAGMLLGRLAGSGTVGTGLVICAVAPAEITSSLVAVLAAGAGEVAVLCMASSLALGTVLTPELVTLGLQGEARVDTTALLLELALCVAVPLIAGVALRTYVSALADQGPRCLDLAAVSVVLVVFVAAGASRGIVATLSLPVAVGGCLALQGLSYAVGFGLGRLMRYPRAVRRAVVFPIGMREFGIATAVALTVAPEAAAVAGVYGILVMITGPALAMGLRRRSLRATADRRSAAGR
jgi:BASS family bile acid:Na+ symporter